MSKKAQLCHSYGQWCEACNLEHSGGGFPLGKQSRGWKQNAGTNGGGTRCHQAGQSRARVEQSGPKSDDETGSVSSPPATGGGAQVWSASGSPAVSGER